MQLLKIKKIKSAFLIVSFFSFFLFGKSALAQVNTIDASSISISPPTFEITANPGDRIENTIKISNRTDRPLDFVTDKRNFTAVGEEGAVGLTNEETSFSLASWIDIQPSSGSVAPRNTETFTFVINVPLNAEPGGHFGSIVFKTGGDEELQQPGATVAQEIASLVLVRIAGDVSEEADIVSFEPVKSFYEYGPVDLEMRIENTGNVHVKPQGTITITNIFGQEVDQFEIEPKNVLPDAVRLVRSTWNTKYMFGTYTATAALTYGNEGSTIVATTRFSGMPYKVVGIASIVALLALVLLVKARKRFRKAFKVLFSG